MSSKTLNDDGEILVTTTDVEKLEDLVLKGVNLLEVLVAQQSLILAILDDSFEAGLVRQEIPTIGDK